MSELISYQEKGRKIAERWAIVQSLIDKRRKLDKNLDAVLQEIYADVERLIVHQDTELALATANQVPILEQAPNCRGAKDLIKVAEWCCHG